jgi:hypothetical protein
MLDLLTCVFRLLRKYIENVIIFDQKVLLFVIYQRLRFTLLISLALIRLHFLI